MSKAGRSEELEKLLEQVLKNNENLKAFIGELGIEKKDVRRLSATTSEGAVAAMTEAAPGLLKQMLTNTKQTEPDRAKDLVKNLVDQALASPFDGAIAAIDHKLSQQLNVIMHDPKFTKLEGTWRGLHYLVTNSETGTSIKIRVLNVSKRELNRDLTNAVEFDQSHLFKKIYENEFGTPGGEPYGALIGDYEWTHHPDDVETLNLMSNIAAAAFAPFITAAGAGMFGFESWTELSSLRDLANIFETADYVKWRRFRDNEDARFVVLTIPRVLARVPYGAATKLLGEFAHEEAPVDADGKSRALSHGAYVWSNAAYVMGGRLTDAFATYGICTAIRGVEGGGKVENLPTHIFTSDDGDVDMKCPTEIGITDRREFELSNQGFLPICHYKNVDYAAFFGSQTAQKPKKVRPPRGHRERRDLGPPALHHGQQPVRALSEGDSARQDRQFHGARRPRVPVERLDPELREPERERRAGHEGPLPTARRYGRGSRYPRQAGSSQCRRLSANLVADGRADCQHALPNTPPVGQPTKHAGCAGLRRGGRRQARAACGGRCAQLDPVHADEAGLGGRMWVCVRSDTPVGWGEVVSGVRPQGRR